MKRLKPAIPVILFSGVLEAPPGSELADLVITKRTLIVPVLDLLVCSSSLGGGAFQDHLF